MNHVKKQKHVWEMTDAQVQKLEQKRLKLIAKAEDMSRDKTRVRINPFTNDLDKEQFKKAMRQRLVEMGVKTPTS